MKEEKEEKKKWMAADLLFCFSSVSVGGISLFKQRARRALWWVECPPVGGHPFGGHPLPKELANAKSSSQLHFLFKAP